MFFTVLVLLLFAAALIALGSGLAAMLHARGGRALYRALMWRLLICLLLVVVVIIGLYSGRLGYQAPWLSAP